MANAPQDKWANAPEGKGSKGAGWLASSLSLSRKVASGAVLAAAVWCRFLPLRAMPSADASRAEQADKIAPWLHEKLQTSGPAEMLVLLDSAADLSPAGGLTSRAEKGQFVYDALRADALQTQQPLVAWFESRGLKVTRFWVINALLVKGNLSLAYEVAALRGVKRIIGNPVVHGLEAYVEEKGSSGDAEGRAVAGGVSTPETRKEAVESEAVSRLDHPGSSIEGGGPDMVPNLLPLGIRRSQSATASYQPGLAARVDAAVDGGTAMLRAPASTSLFVDPTSTTTATTDFSTPAAAVGFVPDTIECGVGAIKANAVWQTGVRGEGIVVASMDTGVDWTHPAIQTKYRGWNGGTPDHAYSWHDAIEHTTVPMDDNNHGTHTTGTMVGDDGAGNQIGVAPGARWIACRNMDHGDGRPSTYLECAQWGLAPYPEGADPLHDGRPDLAADITNNSWSCPPSEGCDAFSLQQAYENVRAAGQMTVAAAQNAGPDCGTVRDPLGIYDAVFSAGALNCTGILASFSSRGPVTSDGSNRLKPNVAAPGVSVRSSIRTGGTQLYQFFSGTSMASPHTAGAMALLWSARPNLKHLIRISRCYLEQSAGPASIAVPTTCGGTSTSDRPNNFWGWGMIDALAAVNMGTTVMAPDGDSDGVADACDCAPLSGGAFDPPPEVAGEGFAVDKRTLRWSTLASLSGTGTTYDVVRGLVSQMRSDGGVGGALCRSNDQGPTFYLDLDTPPVGQAFYYLTRGQNVCGSGTYGNRSNGLPRTPTSCQ